MHQDYHVSQFNGGTAPMFGNFTQRSSFEGGHYPNILNPHQLAYHKTREVSTTVPMKQRQSKQVAGVTSK
jgi:hypothetical protein